MRGKKGLEFTLTEIILIILTVLAAIAILVLVLGGSGVLGRGIDAIFG